MVKDSYSYWLNVDGSAEERKAVFAELCTKEDVIGSMLVATDMPVFSQYQVPDMYGTVEERSEDELDDIFHDVALAVPGATLTLEAINEDRKITAYIKRFRDDMYQETRPQITIPPLREDGNVPFDLRQTAPAPEENKKVFMLCEEYENDNCPRQFTVLAVSEDKDALRKLMAAKISKDEYGVIGANGVYDEGPDRFSSEFENDSFVEYYILEEDVLNRDNTLSMLKTEAYNTEFVFPKGFREILLDTLRECAENNHFGLINRSAGADALMADKQLQAEAKNYIWSTNTEIVSHYKNSVKAFCNSYLSNKLIDQPNFLEEIGAIEPFTPPKNLKDIVIDCVYDVSKMHHIPVNGPERVADIVMRSSYFRDSINRMLEGVSSLEPGTIETMKATTLSMAYVKDYIEKTNPDLKKSTQKHASLNDQIRNAEDRTSGNDKPGPTKEPER